MRRPPITLRGALGLFLAITLAMPARAQGRDSDALRVALVFNIIRFVEFSLKPQGAPLMLCVDRNAPSGAGMAALNGQHIGAQPLTVRVVADDGIDKCDILYLGKASPAAIAKAQQPGLLLIGEGRDFLSNGGIIGLVQTGKQIRFEINVRVARREHINISSQLLRLAARVQQ